VFKTFKIWNRPIYNKRLKSFCCYNSHEVLCGGYTQRPRKSPPAVMSTSRETPCIYSLYTDAVVVPDRYVWSLYKIIKDAWYRVLKQVIPKFTKNNNSLTDIQMGSFRPVTYGREENLSVTPQKGWIPGWSNLKDQVTHTRRNIATFTWRKWRKPLETQVTCPARELSCNPVRYSHTTSLGYAVFFGKFAHHAALAVYHLYFTLTETMVKICVLDDKEIVTGL